MQWKGVVHGNIVVLDKGEQLPEGVRVTVTIDQTDVMGTEDLTPNDLEQRRAWASQMRALGQQLTGRQMNLGDLVLEGREELEERA
jgi:hypothetical protein